MEQKTLAVVVTLAHAWAAFAILPIYVSLEKIDRSLLEAASDLGDGPVAAERVHRVPVDGRHDGATPAGALLFPRQLWVNRPGVSRRP